MVLLLFSTTARAGPFGTWKDTKIQISTSPFYVVSLYDKTQEPAFYMQKFDTKEIACSWADMLKAHPEQFINVQVSYIEYQEIGVKVECE